MDAHAEGEQGKSGDGDHRGDAAHRLSPQHGLDGNDEGQHRAGTLENAVFAGDPSEAARDDRKHDEVAGISEAKDRPEARAEDVLLCQHAEDQRAEQHEAEHRDPPEDRRGGDLGVDRGGDRTGRCRSGGADVAVLPRNCNRAALLNPVQPDFQRANAFAKFRDFFRSRCSFARGSCRSWLAKLPNRSGAVNRAVGSALRSRAQRDEG